MSCWGYRNKNVKTNDYNYNNINIPIFSRQQKGKTQFFQVRQILICSVLEINIQQL